MLGSCSMGRSRRESLEARAARPSPSALRGGRRSSGRRTCRSAASGASWAAPRGRSAGAAGRRRGTRSRRWRAPATRNRKPGTAGTPSGERATSASNASGCIAGLSCSGPSGLVNSSAPVGASSSSPTMRQRRAADARPQPALDALLARHDRGRARGARRTGKRPAGPRTLAGPRSTRPRCSWPSVSLQRLPQDRVDLEGGAVRAQAQRVGRHAAAGLERDRERPAGGVAAGRRWSGSHYEAES